MICVVQDCNDSSNGPADATASLGNILNAMIWLRTCEAPKNGDRSPPPVGISSVPPSVHILTNVVQNPDPSQAPLLKSPRWTTEEPLQSGIPITILPNVGPESEAEATARCGPYKIGTSTSVSCHNTTNVSQISKTGSWSPGVPGPHQTVYLPDNLIYMWFRTRGGQVRSGSSTRHLFNCVQYARITEAAPNHRRTLKSTRS